MVDGFWNYVEKKNNGYACKFCEFKFSKMTSVTRIKSHLSGIENQGTRICEKVPEDVKQAASLAWQGGKKRRKPMPSSSNDVVVQNPMRGLEMSPVKAQRLQQMMEGANLSGIELEKWVDSSTGGELVIIDQSRAPEVIEALPPKGKTFQTTELVGRAFERISDNRARAPEVIAGMTLKGEEVECLKRLEALKCNFCDLIDFSKYVKSWEETQPPRAYYFIVGPAVPYLPGIHKTELNNTVRFCNCSINREADFVTLPKTIQALEIVQCHDMTSLCVVSSMKHAVKLKSLVIWDCNGIEYLLSLSSVSPDTLQSLETLYLISLENFCDLFSGQRAPPPPFPSNGTFSILKTCKISGCPSIKELFPADLMQNLQNLEVIEVLECKKMETIIAAAGGGFMGEDFSTSTEISLPKLRVFTLVHLPELQSIYNEGRIVCSLEKITAVDCLKLKRIPFWLPRSCLRKIKLNAYPKQWWDSVEWHF